MESYKTRIIRGISYNLYTIWNTILFPTLTIFASGSLNLPPEISIPALAVSPFLGNIYGRKLDKIIEPAIKNESGENFESETTIDDKF